MSPAVPASIESVGIPLALSSQQEIEHADFSVWLQPRDSPQAFGLLVPAKGSTLLPSTPRMSETDEVVRARVNRQQ